MGACGVTFDPVRSLDTTTHPAEVTGQLPSSGTPSQEPFDFPYDAYSRIIRRKLWEVVPKELIRFGLLGTAQERRYVWERLGWLPRTIRRLDRRPIWIHANAFGEVLAAKPLVRALRRRYPAVPLVVSTMNFSADTKARTEAACDGVFFAPYDSPRIVSRVLRQVRPRCLIFVEADLLPNLIRASTRQGVSVAVASGRYMDLQYWFDRRIRLTAEVFSQVSQFCMASEPDADQIRRLVPDARITLTGNLKLDALRLSAQADIDGAMRLQQEFGLASNPPVWVAGSVHPGEDEIVIDAFMAARAQCPGLVLLLAPRYPEHAARCERLLTARGLRCVRRSAVQRGQARDGEEAILLDAMGELRQCYALGTAAFVGGSLVPERWVPPGFVCEGHNPAEPVLFGKPVLFGPRMGNFSALRDACLQHGLGWQVGDATQLSQRVVELIRNPDLRREIAQRSGAFWAAHPPAAEQTVEAIHHLLKGDHEPS